MTKNYAKPEIEIIKLTTTDIIQTSGEQPAKLYNGGFDMGTTTADSIISQY